MPWIRIIEPKTELRTLSIRGRLTSEQLAEQQFRCPKINEHAARTNFTPVSAFQFFIDGVKQDFFESDETTFGLVINRTEANRNVMFRDSTRCEVSDGIFNLPLTEQEFEAQLIDNSFFRITEREASGVVKRQWEKCLEDHKKYKQHRKEDGLDEPEEPSLNWTEGLFRHKFSDVDAILINQNEDSLRKGYAFAKVLEAMTGKKLEFRTWDEEKAELAECDREKIKEVLGFRKDESNPSKQVIDGETQSKIREYQSYLSYAQRGGR
jgi:hypothetical protein